jgi:hypothetical protein
MSEQEQVQYWYGEAYLIGGVGVLASEYPIRSNVGEPDDEGVQLDFDEPELIPGPLFRQRIVVSLRAPWTAAEEMARKALLEVADVASFRAHRPVRVVLSSLTNEPLDKTEQISGTIVSLQRKRVVREPVPIDISHVLGVWRETELRSADDERKIRRALRWLNSATGAADDVEEFSALAFGAEAIGPLLPTPSAKWLRKARESGDPETARDTAPTPSERLRHFATTTLKIPEAEWRAAWRKRNELCHGGLSESAEERAKLRKAATVVELTLLSGLKTVLNTPESEEPAVVRRSPIPDIKVMFSQHIPFMKPTE